jgi:hypothetical protein
MSKHHNDNLSHGTEAHDGAAHTHDAAGHHEQQDHTGHGHSSRAQERNGAAHLETPPEVVAHGIASFSHSDIEMLAYELWQERGSPKGSPEEDWFRAAQELRSRARTAR